MAVLGLRAFSGSPDPIAAAHRRGANFRKAVSTLPGITCTTRTIMLVEPLVPLPRQDQLVAAIKSNADRLLGEPIPAMGAPIYAVARHYCAAGVPTVLYGAGPKLPSDANAHGPNERLRLSDLPLASEIVALACYDLLAKGNSIR